MSDNLTAPEQKTLDYETNRFVANWEFKEALAQIECRLLRIERVLKLKDVDGKEAMKTNVK